MLAFIWLFHASWDPIIAMHFSKLRLEAQSFSQEFWRKVKTDHHEHVHRACWGRCLHVEQGTWERHSFPGGREVFSEVWSLHSESKWEPGLLEELSAAHLAAAYDNCGCGQTGPQGGQKGKQRLGDLWLQCLGYGWREWGLLSRAAIGSDLFLNISLWQQCRVYNEEKRMRRKGRFGKL